MNSSWPDPQKNQGTAHLCLPMSRIINSGLSREPEPRGLFRISGREQTVEGVGWVLAGVPFFLMASFSFQSRFLQKSSESWTAMPRPLWLQQRANGVSLKGGVPPVHCCCFFLFDPAGVPITSQFGGAWEERGKGPLRCMTFPPSQMILYSLIPPFVQFWPNMLKPLPCFIQGARREAFPWGLKYIACFFSLLPS